MYRFFMERNNLINLNNLAQKVIYLCMVIVSINLSADWLATSTYNLYEVQNETVSFDDIIKLNLQSYSVSTTFATKFNERRKEYEFFDYKKTELLNGPSDIRKCIENVTQYQNVICIMTDIMAAFYLQEKFEESKEIPAVNI